MINYFKCNYSYVKFLPSMLQICDILLWFIHLFVFSAVLLILGRKIWYLSLAIGCFTRQYFLFSLQMQCFCAKELNFELQTLSFKLRLTRPSQQRIVPFYLQHAFRLSFFPNVCVFWKAIQVTHVIHESLTMIRNVLLLYDNLFDWKWSISISGVHL